MRIDLLSRAIILCALLIGGVGSNRVVMAVAQVPALPDELALTDPAWARPGYATDATPFLKRTRYLIALDVAWATGQISGQARILFVNTTPDTLSHIVFRLYPNSPPTPLPAGSLIPAKPRMTVSTVTVGGAAAAFQIRDSYKSVLDIPLTVPLVPGGGVSIDVTYVVSYAAPVDRLDGWETFPLLAVYENGAWREDIATKGLDYIFAESALYAVILHAPSDVALYSVGVITHTDTDASGATYHITTGPVRDFVYALAKGWSYLVGKGGPVPIDVHYRGSVAPVQEETDIAVEAMSYYDDRFGPYPYAHLTMLDLAFPSGGIQFPTLLYNDNARDTNYRRFITAHEVAHEWFYGVAGNDLLRHAWLDESLVQISLYLFYHDIFGANVAEAEWSHILLWANRAPKSPRLIDTPVMSFTDFSDYMSHTYGLGAVFFRGLAEQIGLPQFEAGLAAYYKQVYYGVGTPQQLFDAIQAQTPIPLAPMFCAKIGTQCTTEAK